jgi:hypothetical protein
MTKVALIEVEYDWLELAKIRVRLGCDMDNGGGMWGHMIGENDECGHKTYQDLSESGL